MKERELLDIIVCEYRKVLKDNLVGIYIHGSIAFGCFHWENSDIAFVVVTTEAPSAREKEALIKVLIGLEKETPPKGLEMSVVLLKYCQNFVYPTPFELHFSNFHKERCKKDIKQYCAGMNGTDWEAASGE